jgi:hypothetical protein
LNLRTDHAKERNAKDKVLSVNVGWQLEARTGAHQAVPKKLSPASHRLPLMQSNTNLKLT